MRLTRRQSAEVLKAVRLRLDVHHPQGPYVWHSHGYEYYFCYDFHGWAIVAGCRTWYSFRTMRIHYGPHWRSIVFSKRAQKIYRRESLEIARDMEAFAKRFKIKLC